MQRTMTSTMFDKSDSSLLTNGSGDLTDTRYEDAEDKPAAFSRRVRLTEWTFSLTLLALSLSIVLGKLCVHYGGGPPLRTGVSTTTTRMYDRLPSVMSDLSRYDMKRLSADGVRFVNASNVYAGAAADMLVTISGRYWWLLQATVCGLLITCFTWFIVYKDSSIPGVNPPAPFSPPRQRVYGCPGRSRIQMSYLIGVLNGILFFVYMCL